MKRKIYSGIKFHHREELTQAMEKHLAYYNNEGIQRKLNIHDTNGASQRLSEPS
jgi:hypothetical protein